jgi:type I restriction enzyme M protein
MSMPDELFYPVGAITCIMVFTAHVPHKTSNKKTWFGYWKVDGFVKTKHRGRVDIHNRWSAIRDRWVEMFLNREVHAGESVIKKVGADDEWCAEAYMETDYSTLTKSDFGRELKRYVVFNILNDSPESNHEEIE